MVKTSWISNSHVIYMEDDWYIASLERITLQNFFFGFGSKGNVAVWSIINVLIIR